MDSHRALSNAAVDTLVLNPGHGLFCSVSFESLLDCLGNVEEPGSPTRLLLQALQRVALNSFHVS